MAFSKQLSQRIEATEEYEMVCSSCRDDILLYPSISGRTSYTQEEVEECTVFRILNSLDDYKRCKKALEEILEITASALCTAPMKCFENQHRAGRYCLCAQHTAFKYHQGRGIKRMIGRVFAAVLVGARIIVQQIRHGENVQPLQCFGARGANPFEILDRAHTSILAI